MINSRIQSIENTSRDREILRRKKAGESNKSIAKDMKLSGERVRQIVKRGLTRSQRAVAAALNNASQEE